jgi:uncharacterized protein (DUF169 family)
MLSDESEIPPDALRPKRDRGYHLAQCQAFSISRFQGRTVAMLKEDNWCWGALFSYGLVDPAMADRFPELQNDKTIVPMLEYGKYAGVLSAPLKTAGFEPDIVLIYSTTGQLRHMLHALSFIRKGVVNSPIYPVASCALSVVPALRGENCITLPDPGEVGRGCAGDDEIIFSLPAMLMIPPSGRKNRSNHGKVDNCSVVPDCVICDIMGQPGERGMPPI